MTEWNLIFLFYVFSHSLKELETCDEVVQKQTTEGREEKPRVGVLAGEAASLDPRKGFGTASRGSGALPQDPKESVPGTHMGSMVIW